MGSEASEPRAPDCPFCHREPVPVQNERDGFRITRYECPSHGLASFDVERIGEMGENPEGPEGGVV